MYSELTIDFIIDYSYDCYRFTVCVKLSIYGINNCTVCQIISLYSRLDKHKYKKIVNNDIKNIL